MQGLTKLNLSHCNLVCHIIDNIHYLHYIQYVQYDSQTQHLLSGLLTNESLPAIRNLNISFNACGDISARALFSQSLSRFIESRADVMVDVRGMKVELVLLDNLKQRVLL